MNGTMARLPVALTWAPAGDAWVAEARRVDSPNQDQRPPDVQVSLAVVHFISVPPGEFGSGDIDRLFTNRLDPDRYPDLSALRVSSHFLIDRCGALTQYVACDRRAWHAGVSRWMGRERCNDFSLGIELEGSATAAFEDAQYLTLNALLHLLAQRYPLAHVAGHEHIAPGRKPDPGPCFDWSRVDSLRA